MYAYEIIIENDKVKTNDFNIIIKLLKYFVSKDFEMIFVNNKTHSYINVIDNFDIAMIEDNIEI
jgi:hypothetical protein